MNTLYISSQLCLIFYSFDEIMLMYCDKNERIHERIFSFIRRSTSGTHYIVLPSWLSNPGHAWILIKNKDTRIKADDLSAKLNCSIMTIRFYIRVGSLTRWARNNHRYEAFGFFRENSSKKICPTSPFLYGLIRFYRTSGADQQIKRIHRIKRILVMHY